MSFFKKHFFHIIKKKRYSFSFSLIEIMVVLAIITIICSIILAQNHYWQKRNQLKKAAQEFALNVRWAQGLALETRRVPVGTCPPTASDIPEGFGVAVTSANTYLIFFNCKPMQKRYVGGQSQTYKTFILASSLSFVVGVNKDVYFLKPNPDCYANAQRNLPPPNCAGSGCYQNFTIQDSTGQSITITVNDGCRVAIN